MTDVISTRLPPDTPDSRAVLLYGGANHYEALEAFGLELPFEPVPETSAWRCCSCGNQRQMELNEIIQQPWGELSCKPRGPQACPFWVKKDEVRGQETWGAAVNWHLLGKNDELHREYERREHPGVFLCGSEDKKWVFEEQARQQAAWLKMLQMAFEHHQEVHGVETDVFHHRAQALPFPAEWLAGNGRQLMLQTNLLVRLARVEELLVMIKARMEGAGIVLSGMY